MIGPQLPRRGADGVQRRQVELLQHDVGVWARGGDPRGGVLALVEIADRQHHVGPVRGQCESGLVAETGVGSGDDGDTPRLVGNVRGGPLGHQKLLNC